MKSPQLAGKACLRRLPFGASRLNASITANSSAGEIDALALQVPTHSILSRGHGPILTKREQPEAALSETHYLIVPVYLLANLAFATPNLATSTTV